jgi:hypothetical protein
MGGITGTGKGRPPEDIPYSITIEALKMPPLPTLSKDFR